MVGKRGKEVENRALWVALRYIFLLLIGICIYYSDIFYRLFFVLTAYPTNFLLSFIFDSRVYQYFIIANNHPVEIIPACVAVSAYFLLLILNLTTKMDVKKRAGSIAFSFVILLLVNIVRLFAMIFLFVSHSTYFDLLHIITWYVLSILIVVGVWFLTESVFKIDGIPIYDDIREIIKSCGAPRRKYAKNKKRKKIR